MGDESMRCLQGRRTSWRTLAVILLVVTAGVTACGDASGPSAGLPPGTYSVKFELPPSISIPADLQGRHDFTFRVRAPAASVSDVDLVSSRRIPTEGPAEFDYLVLDPSTLIINEERWQIRFPYAEGDFSVSVTLLGIEGGGIVAPSGCYGRSEPSASFLGAGCVIEAV
jgi:hypothetical protein